MHIFLGILGSEKPGQLIEYYMRNFFIEEQCWKYAS